MRPTLTSKLAASALGALTLVGALGATSASAKDGDVRVRATCSQGAAAKLKLGPRGGRIETEVEVDSNRNGQRWSVRITDNGVVVHTASAATAAPSGSFSVRKVITNRAGTDRVQAVATNAATGERCSLAASV